MSLLQNIVGGLRSLLRRKQVCQELDEELNAFLGMAAEGKMKDGMSREEALRAVRLERGNMESAKETVRTAGWESFVETCWQDLRLGLRTLRKSAGFSAIAILILALGIGANTAIFSVVYAVLLRPLPFQNPSRLVWSWGACAQCDRAAVAPLDFLDYRAQNQSFEYYGAMAVGESLFNLTGNDRPVQIKGAMITAGYFEALGVQPRFGRVFSVADEQVTDPQTIILSHHLWQDRFGGDPGVVGKTISLDGESRTVIGALSKDMPSLSDADIWFPAAFRNQGMQSRRSHFLRPIGLLKSGVTIAQAQSEMSGIAERLARQYPDTNHGFGVKLEPLQTVLIGNVGPAFMILVGAVALVLLIACANIASLLFARNTAREREIAIRTALGAGRRRLLRQLLTESLVLALAGGVAGIFLAAASVELLKRLGPQSLPRLDEVNVSGVVLAFTFVTSIFTGILFGLAPALKASRRDLTRSLKEGGASGESRSKHRAYDSLVVAEVALSVVVLIASGLLFNSFWRLMRVHLGFDPANVLTTELSLISPRYNDAPPREAFFNQLQDRLQSSPAVKSVGFISELPLSGEGNDTFFTITEHPSANPNDTADADFRNIDGDYFGAMRIPLLAGRAFDRRDSTEMRNVVIVNEPFVKKYFPNEEPIGKHLKMFEGQPGFVVREIVGVVGGNKHFALQEGPRPEMFQPGSFLQMNAVVRSEGDPAMLTSGVRQAIHEIDPDEATATFRTMDDVISLSAAGDRFNTLLLGTFGAMALLLTAAGIFGVLSYLVTQRTREIGLRMALGAQRRDVLRVIVMHGLRLALLGLCIGVGASLVVTRWMSSVLFDVKPTDPVTFVIVAVVLGTVSFLASYIPARRAMSVDPMVALRYE